MRQAEFDQQSVLDFWFPDNGFWESSSSFEAWIGTCMYGGMDDRICRDFAVMTEDGARGLLDHWAQTARGRLALLIVLDQFPRSLWRDTPKAFAQDIKANLLVLEGIKNGDFATYKPWEKLFSCIALGHCEGPDHLERLALIDDLTKIIVRELPSQLAHLSGQLEDQNTRVRKVIETFGRHPHRNQFYGRLSTPAEEVYIAEGDFPHVAGTALD